MSVKTIQHIKSDKLFLKDPSDFKYPDTITRQLELENVESRQIGQDYYVWGKINDNDLILCVCDGHGSSGEHYSYLASHLLVNDIKANWNNFYELLLKKDEETIKTRLSEIYSLNESKLLDGSYESIDNDSGTTICISMIFNINDKKIMITSNVGDSVILWKPLNSDLIECSEEHNCDNIDAVQFYLDHLKIKRNELLEKSYLQSKFNEEYLESELLKLKPLSINCSRINCLGGPIWHHVRNPDNSLKKLPMYKYINDENCVLNQETYETVSVYFPYGIQTVRTPETYLRVDGRKVVVSGSEHKNWGSSLDNGTQVLRVFGDFNQGQHTPCIPSIKIVDISVGGDLLLATDGLMDLFHYNELMNLVEYGDIENINKQMFNKCLKYHVFNYMSMNKKKFPKWDDVCGLFLKII